MPRPIRIQYPHAFYHIMNHGRGRQKIFHGDDYYQAFLDTLGEAHSRFDAIIHAYCLLGNHYHLLIETPRANLDRIMRHINGLYTQRYNRLKRTDGPLFRGRYKAVLADADSYLAPLSRYIHLRPSDERRAAADSYQTYQWSSYLSYVNRRSEVSWLERDSIYQALGRRQKFSFYRSYVEEGVDDELATFYGKGNLAGILGSLEFRKNLSKKKSKLKVSGELAKALNTRPAMQDILATVANVCKVTESSLTQRQSGRRSANLPRKFAMFCCQQLGDITLKEIAGAFSLNHEGSVSPSLHDIHERLNAGELKNEYGKVKEALGVLS